MEIKLSKKCRVILLSAILFILPILTFSNNFTEIPLNGSKINKIRTSGTHTNIVIDDKMTTNTLSEGNWTWALSQLGGTGSGTPEEPYLIEDEIFISAGGESLIITNSRKNFIIRDCAINSSDAAGLLLANVTNGQIVNNEIFDNVVGIALIDVNDTIISDNNVYYTATDGIYLQYCYSNTFLGNIVYNNSECGINLKDSAFNVLRGNIVYNNSWSGIYVQTSDYNVLMGNEACKNSKYGINLKTSDFNNLSGNAVYNNTEDGINLENCDSSNITGNTANDNNLHGIHLYQCDYSKITGNTASDHTGDIGIYLFECDYNTVSGNTANYNGKGYSINNSHYNNITGNTANYNGRGYSIKDSHYNNITGNNANNNSNYGIGLYNSNNNTILGNFASFNYDGIFITGDLNSTIIGNTVRYNGRGIHIEEDCYSNEITENIIYNNTIGIHIEFKLNSYNTIYGNFFLKNEMHAYDDGTNNKWNSSTIGNYWDIWTSPDESPLDGIVDEPYNISGPAGSKDYLPIAEDGAPSITINSPDPDDAFGSSAPSFNVSITDDYLDGNMWYTIDGGLNNYTFTANGMIDQTAWGMTPEGHVTLTFYASDIPGNIGFAEVSIDKDVQVPIVTINLPAPDGLFGVIAPSFDVRITDDNLDTMWYTLDEGLNNYTFTINGTIDQTAWITMTDGPITLKFYANDTAAHSMFAEVSIEKDATAPTIVINSPTDGEEFGSEPPLFNITVTDVHLDLIWYSFDGGVTTYAITDNAEFNQTVWAELPEGNVTINFYADDTLGNEASESVIVVKNIPAGAPYTGVIITVFVVSIVGGVVVIGVTYIFMKKRVTPD